MSLNAFFKDTVYVKEPTGYNDDGSPAYGGAAVAVLGQLERRHKRIKHTAGADELEVYHLFITHTPISKQAKVWFNGENTADNNVGRQPADVGVLPDPLGGANAISHYEVYL